MLDIYNEFGQNYSPEAEEIKNVYDEDSFKQNALNLLPYFKHENYLKVDNKPVFLVYHDYLF